MNRPKKSNTADADRGAESDTWQPDTPLPALDILSTPIMIADADIVIRYVNPASIKMFTAIDDALKKDLAHFDASAVVGTSIDSLHKNPSHRRGTLDDMWAPHDQNIRAGGKALAFCAAPRLDAKGLPSS